MLEVIHRDDGDCRHDADGKPVISRGDDFCISAMAIITCLYEPPQARALMLIFQRAA